jgi:preprotein translocase subunit SecE
MSNELNKNEDQAVEVVEVAAKKETKNAAKKKENIFKRLWKKFVKLCKDTVGEMQKVTWTSKTDLIKNTKLVLVTVVAVAAVIAVIDTGFAYLINWVSGLIG